jgi:hypothetical protein
MQDIDSTRKPDNVTLAFMRRIQHVYFAASTTEHEAAGLPRSPILKMFVQPASTDLAIRFIRSLHADEEKAPVNRAFRALLRKRGLSPILGGEPYFDDGQNKSGHSTLTVRLAADQAVEARALVFDLETANRHLYREAKFASRKFDAIGSRPGNATSPRL